MTATGGASGRASAIGGAVLALACVMAVVAAPATAAGSDSGARYFGGSFSLMDMNAYSDLPVGASVGWDDPVAAVVAPGDVTSPLVAPPGTGNVATFLAPQGREADVDAWNASAPWPLMTGGEVLSDVTPYHQITPGAGRPSGTNATAAVSGDYSIGVAYLDAGGRHVVPGGLYFVHIRLTGNADPYEARYTWEPVDEADVGSLAPLTVAGASEPSPGLLGFVSPGTFDAGTPGGLTVQDGRGAAGSGWTATASTDEGTRTLATGAAGGVTVDVPDTAAAITASATLTLTVVSG